MNIRILIIYLFFINSICLGQTVKELEHDLSWFHSFEKYGDKIAQARKLLLIDPFNYSATEYICRYYNDRSIDSISIYFDNLISKYPTKSEPYYLRSEFFFLEKSIITNDESKRLKVKYLNQGLRLNPRDISIVYKLAETYYYDFILPFEKDWRLHEIWDDVLIDSTFGEAKKDLKFSTFERAADSSLHYLYKIWDIKKDARDVIYFPIRQLECYLDQTNKSPIPQNAEMNFDQCYFSNSFFYHLTNDWECDFTTNYLFQMEMSKRNAKKIETQLIGLKENCLFDKVIPLNATIYRFTWLRTFHPPIAIRIENIENKIMLYWKVGKGKSGDKPKGLKKSGKRKLTVTEWIQFENYIKQSNFENFGNRTYVPMTDGATWTLERKTDSSFNAHNTNSPTAEMSNACLYLLNLSKIKVNVEDIY